METKYKLPENPDEIQEFLEGLDDDELREFFDGYQQWEAISIQEGPQTPEELHEWIVRELGYDIPRVAVCENHQAPFDFLSDLYFNKTEAALGVGPRGGAKTMMVAILHFVNAKFKSGIETCTFGAIEEQSFKAYGHLKNWIYDEDGNKKPDIISSLMRETLFKNGSRIFVLGSTPSAVNGPHPQIAHADEIELMREDTWQESRMMTITGKTKDGRIITPQDIATSTRKGPSGRVQRLIDEIDLAKSEGFKPPRKLYMWCCKETAAQVKNCRYANPGLPESMKCPCNTIRKGEWEDGSPRLLSDICQGDFYKSRGWQPFAEIVKQFTEVDRDSYEVQQLCSKPEMKHHYIPMWKDDKHLIRGFEPFPENGPIYMAVDPGGTDEHAVSWYQLLRYEIEVVEWFQPDPENLRTKRLKQGTLVCFDELYIADIGNSKLAEFIKQKEDKYKSKYPDFKIEMRVCDPQGKAAREDLKDAGLKNFKWKATRDFDEHIKTLRSMFEDDLFVADGEKCIMFAKEIKNWRANPETGKEIHELQHLMSSFRYCAENLKRLKQKNKGANIPKARGIPRTTVQYKNQEAYNPVEFRGKEESEYKRWKRSLGQPLTRSDK